MLKAGERVVVAIRSLDFVHGMNIPDLGMRLDLVPGRVTRLELQPQGAGRRSTSSATTSAATVTKKCTAASSSVHSSSA